MYLFFDTETTGLPKKWQASLRDLDNWPRMVQLAWLLYDEKGKLVSSRDRIIRPEGYEIPENVSRIHGITTERARGEGLDLALVLEEFANEMKAVKYLVAHNMSFDEKIAGAEYLRKNMPNILLRVDKICTMRSTTEYVNIAGSYGYKWPSLSELHKKLFDTGFDNAHNALVDVGVLAKCFFELKERGVITCA